jgi:hypothetical protein
LRKRVGQHLDGDVTIQLAVRGAAHRSHSTFPEFGDYPEMPNRLFPTHRF